MVTELALQQAFLDQGLARVAWWNGRVLTAEDLRDQQIATDAADRRLGRAIGAGVVDGLLVSPAADRRSVEVTAGLAVDQAGEVLDLPVPVRVPLVPPEPQDGSGRDPAGFVSCAELPVDFTAAGHGIYLLAIASATGASGAAAGADVQGIATRDCGPRYDVAGVQFRLVEVDLATLAGDRGHDDADVGVLEQVAGGGPAGSRLRNLVAAVLLDAVPRRASIRDPFGATAGAPPVLDELTAAGRLTDCDVPLAVFTWQAGAIGLLDVWSVRRPPSSRVSGGAAWPERMVGDAGVATGLATLRQFTDHLAALVGAGVSAADRRALRVGEVFRYLPPAVLLPEAAAGHPRGVSLDRFLAGVVRRAPRPLAGGRLWPLLRASLTAPPVDLDAGEGLRTSTVAGSDEVPGAQPFALLTADHLSHLRMAPEEELDRLAITDVSPAGDQTVGARITIHGRNFGVPVRRNEVTIGGVPVRSFGLGTSERALVCDVPQLSVLPRAAAIVVATGGQTAQWLLSVVAERPLPTGRLVFTADLGDLRDVDIEVGETYVLWWRVTADATAPATFSFAPRVVELDGAGEDAWLESARVVDARGDEVTTVVLEPGDVRAGQRSGTPIGLQVTVPKAAERVHLALLASCLDAPDDPGLNAASPPATLEVGRAPEVGDERIVFEPAAPAGRQVGLVDGVMVFPPGGLGALSMRLRFGEPGRFTVTAAVEPDARGWELVGLEPAVEFSGGPQEPQKVLVRLQAPTAPVAGHLRVTVGQVRGRELYHASTTIPLSTIARR